MAIYDLVSKRGTRRGVREIELREHRAYVDTPVDAGFVYVDGSEQQGRQIMTKEEFLERFKPFEVKEPNEQQAPRGHFDKAGFVKRTVQGVIVLAGGLAGWMTAQQADAVSVFGALALILVAFSNIYFNRER